MKKELLWAACISAVLGAGVLVLAGGNEAEGTPWEPLNERLEAVLAVQEGTSKEADAEEEQADARTKSTASVQEAESGAKTSDRADAEEESADEDAARLEKSGSAVQAAAPSPAAAEDTGKIHLNSADTAALMELPGIGEKKAQAIVDYRSQNGPFRDVTDIVKVKGIGPKMLEKMLPDLAL